MSKGLNKTLQMCTVKIESGLGYESSQVREDNTDRKIFPEAQPSPWSVQPYSQNVGCVYIGVTFRYTV